MNKKNNFIDEIFDSILKIPILIFLIKLLITMGLLVVAISIALIL